MAKYLQSDAEYRDLLRRYEERSAAFTAELKKPRDQQDMEMIIEFNRWDNVAWPKIRHWEKANGIQRYADVKVGNTIFRPL